MFALKMLSEGGGLNTELQWLLLTGVVVFFVVIVVGWISSARKQTQPESAHEPVHHAEKKADHTKKEVKGGRKK